MDVPKVKPIKIKEYATKKSNYTQVPRLPMRSIILGPSGSGKYCVVTEYGYGYIP